MKILYCQEFIGFDLIVQNADTEAKVLSLSFFNFVEYKILRNLKYMPAKI